VGRQRNGPTAALTKLRRPYKIMYNLLTPEPKPVVFVGSSLQDLRAFPLAARREAGHQLDRIQNGLAPGDFKPMPSVGSGALEIRIRDAAGAVGENQPHRSGVGQPALPRLVAGAKPMSTQRFVSVWDAIEDTAEEAQNMKLRSALAMALTEHISRVGLNQAQAADLLGVTQPRVSDLVRGKIHLFSLDALVNMASAAGMQIQMRVHESA